MIIFLDTSEETEELKNVLQYLTANGQEHLLLLEKRELVVPKLKNALSVPGLSGLGNVVPIDTSFQLSSNKYKDHTSFAVKGISVGSSVANIIAGPCSVESEAHIYQTAEFLSRLGVKFIRGGAFKPRTSPYSFRGLGVDGLKFIREAADKYQLRVVTELMDLSLLDKLMTYSDIIQVGSRNMSNFYMLTELGKINKPIMLKRGMQARLSEWLQAADYILAGGNEKVILCERGIRSFDPLSRNVMDVAAIPMVHSMSHLPVFADPSHGTGDAKYVNSLSKASLIAGADGLMIEIHPEPSKALSDAQQALTFEEFESLLSELQALTEFSQKPLDTLQLSSF